MYELFEHTADLGLRVTAPDLEQLLAEAGRGLFSIIVENVAEVRAETPIEVNVKGRDPTYLLFDWLCELLVIFDTRRLLLTSFDNVHLDDDGLTVTARGETLDPDRHQLLHEVKAITYHELTVTQTSDGWKAEVIVDI